MRARLGDLLRLGRGDRLCGRLPARLLALRALPRVLEPRLHVLRASPRPHADAAAEAEHRHGHGPRAHGPDRPERAVRLRHRRLPADHGLDRPVVRRRIRRLGRRDQGAPRARRPRARDDLPRRRGDHALERGPGLRPPAGHAPRDPARVADRDGGAVHRRPQPHGDRPDGRGVPGARRAPRPDRARAAGRGGALRRDARARDEAVRGRRLRGRDLGAGCVRAPGDLRLPDRADAGARPRARHQRRRGRVHDRDGPAPRDLPRRRGEGRSAAGGRLLARRRVHDRVRRLGEDRGADADRGARGARRRAFPRQAARVAVLRRGRRPGDRRGRARK